jgi:hypothetical protein
MLAAANSVSFNLQNRKPTGLSLVKQKGDTDERKEYTQKVSRYDRSCQFWLFVFAACSGAIAAEPES